MKLIKSSYEIFEQEPGLEGIYKQIEIAGRICYQSEPKEGKTSKEFVDGLIARKHLSVLEHGTVYLTIYCKRNSELINKYIKNPYSKVVVHYKHEDYMNVYGNPTYYVTTNFRVLQENDWLDDLKYLCEPTEYHEKRVTVKFISNIHFYKDLTRHRRMSYSIESTRFCNYSKGKFGSELTFIIPSWSTVFYNSKIEHVTFLNNGIVYFSGHENEKVTVSIKMLKNHPECIFFANLFNDERDYLKLIESGWKPQQAAKILPQDTKADIIVTGFASDWQHIFSQRTSIIAETGQPDTEISLLMDPLYKEFIERDYINTIT